MKANELQIGDWVYAKFYTSKAKRPTQVDADTIQYIADGGWKETFEPIPLTGEILKVNGWQLLSNYDREAFYDPNGVFSLDFRNGLFRLIIHGNIVVIEHVHELQHALRLCGLNDLADNFKVE